MKAALITDTHLGARSGSRIFRELFRSYMRDIFFPYLAENGIKTLFHDGDFFDNRNSLSLADIDYVENEFIPLLEEYGVHMYIVVGNHDVAFRNTNRVHSLSIFNRCKNVTVYDNEPGSIKFGNKTFLMVPWINPENESHMMEFIRNNAFDNNILLVHAEIKGCKMYKTSSRCDHGIEPVDFKGYHKVISGHFHHPSQTGNIYYMGALFHLNWQDYNDWRGFWVYDSETEEFTTVENDVCLFTRLDYAYASTISDDELKEECGNRFVEIHVATKQDKIDIEDLIHRVEKTGPIKVDLVDTTIFESKHDLNDTNGDETDVESKQVRDYAKDYFNKRFPDSASELLYKLESVMTTAKNRMVEVE